MTLTEEKIKPGANFGHREPRSIPHNHIVLYIGIHTETGEKLVVHRPTHKTEIIYCEPVASFIERFYRA